VARLPLPLPPPPPPAGEEDRINEYAEGAGDDAPSDTQSESEEEVDSDGSPFHDVGLDSSEDDGDDGPLWMLESNMERVWMTAFAIIGEEGPTEGHSTFI
jgi:hypothetical protein